MVISLYKFLSNYYGISLNAACEYSHKIIKKYFRFLRTCSCEWAIDNINLIKSGKIVYVEDSYGKVIPYIAPDELFITNCKFDKTSEEEKDDSDILDDMSNLPDYVVHELLSRYKDRPAFYKVIKNELIKRGIYENKLYRLEKEINILEESEINDKYQRRRKIKCKKS